jgi:hypothetical protein
VDAFVKAGSSGTSPAEDPEICQILERAREILLPFATVDWLTIAPDLVSGFDEFLEVLGPGVALSESHPSLRPDASVPRLTVPVPDTSISSGLSPDAELSPPSAPSPTAPPPQSRSPSSGRDPSPALAPEPSAGPSAPVLRARSTRSAAYRSPRAPQEELTARPAAASSSTAAPVAAARSSSKRGATNIALRPGHSCARCHKRRKACRYPANADSSPSACTLCINDGAECSLLNLSPSVAGRLCRRVSLLSGGDNASLVPPRTRGPNKPKAPPGVVVPVSPTSLPSFRLLDDDMPYSLLPPEIPSNFRFHKYLKPLSFWRLEAVAANSDLVIHQANRRASEAAASQSKVLEVDSAARRRLAHEIFVDMYSAVAGECRVAGFARSRSKSKGKRRRQFQVTSSGESEEVELEESPGSGEMDIS